MNTSRLLYPMFALMLLAAWPVTAQPFVFRHTPPRISAGAIAPEQIDVSIPANGIVRARVICGSRQGYRVYEMTRSGDSFLARLEFGDLARLRYQFEAQSEEGSYHESDYYEVTQPSGGQLARQLDALRAKTESLDALIAQASSTLYGLQNTDPALLAARKNQETARALVLLGQHERELENLRAEVARKQAMDAKEGS